MYPTLSDAQVLQNDRFQHPGGVPVGQFLQSLSFNEVSPVVTAGATGETKSVVAFVAPCKMQITKFQSIMQVVQTGTSNTPVVQLRKGSATVVAATGAIALSGAIGQVDAGVLSGTAANLVLEKGEVLSVDIINPSATITVALQARGQFEWNAIA
jgi:hypothetical protein